jgi:hypothetical protein
MTKPEEEDCTYRLSGAVTCARPARMAALVARGERQVEVRIYSDNRTAPRSADRFCKHHGAQMVEELIALTVDADEIPKGLKT